VVAVTNEYRHVTGARMSFHDYLVSGPEFPDDFDELIERDEDQDRDVCVMSHRPSP
jgi:hypothetical protein